MGHKEFLDCIVTGLSRGVALRVGTERPAPCGEIFPVQEVVEEPKAAKQAAPGFSLRHMVLGMQGYFSAKFHPCH